MKLFAGKPGLIGVEVSARWIKASQGEGPTRVTTRLERKGSGTLTKDEAATLAGVFDRAGFREQRIVLVPAREMLVMETLELPPRSSGAPLEQLARVELARSHRWDPASFEVGLWELPTPGRGGELSHMFAAALPFARSEPMLDACDNAGLRVHAIDVPANALARAFGPTAPDAMLDIGWSGAMLCVMHAGVVVYERTIDEGGLQQLIEPAAKRLDIQREAVESLLLARGADSTLSAEVRGPVTEYLDVLTSEVQRSLAYMAHRYLGWQFRTLGVSGEGAALLGLRERLTAALGIEVTAPPAPASHTLAAGASRFNASAARKEAA
ncbi:MAG TPA: pilus assembly protein PilM [Phycisphaerales bacterium]|nr:pilus assembly protein PilM [Phycisphaerales bacterium]